MPVPLIPCRHRDTGVEAEIPETALRYRHLPAYEPVEDTDRERIRQLQDADTAAAAEQDDAGPAGSTPPSDSPAPAAEPKTTAKSKPATGGKNTKE